MRKHKLHVDALKIESFNTIADPTDVRGTVPDEPGAGCICFAPPCICSAGPDCTAGTQ
jgi:hypothetical protein